MHAAGAGATPSSRSAAEASLRSATRVPNARRTYPDAHRWRSVTSRSGCAVGTLSEVGSPFGFWSEGSDGGVPDKNRRWPRRNFWLTITAFAVVIVLVAIFVHPS